MLILENHIRYSYFSIGRSIDQNGSFIVTLVFGDYSNNTDKPTLENVESITTTLTNLTDELNAHDILHAFYKYFFDYNGICLLQEEDINLLESDSDNVYCELGKAIRAINPIT